MKELNFKSKRPVYLPTYERPLTFKDEFCKPRTDRLVFICFHFGRHYCKRTCAYATRRGDNDTRRTDLNSSGLMSRETYLLADITDKERAAAEINHISDPEHWVSPIEAENRIDHDLFEEDIR